MNLEINGFPRLVLLLTLNARFIKYVNVLEIRCIHFVDVKTCITFKALKLQCSPCINI